MKSRNPRSLKRRRERRRLRLSILLVFVVLAVAVGGYVLVTRFLVVSEVVLEGNQHVKQEDITTLVGLKKGAPVFRYSGREIHRRLLKSPWVREAAVRKEIPGRIIIRLKEAVPVAILLSNGRSQLVDRNGTILEDVKEGTTLFLPVIRGIDPLKDKAAYEEAMRFMRVLYDKKAIGYGSGLEVSGNRPEELTLTIEGLPIKVGVGDIEKKLERLQVVMEEVVRRNMDVEFIDLRFLNKIVVKTVEKAPPPPPKRDAKQKDGKKKKKQH